MVKYTGSSLRMLTFSLACHRDFSVPQFFSFVKFYEPEKSTKHIEETQLKATHLILLCSLILLLPHIML